MKPIRKPLSPRARENFHKSKNGLCAECGGTANPYAIDHVISLENGGADGLDNFQILCLPCHKLKTRIDIVKIAKVRSVRQRHEGHKRPKQSIKSQGFAKSSKPIIEKTRLAPRALYKEPTE